MRFLFYTLGCRTNQFETAAMEAALRSRGHEIVTAEPDVVVVNGCAVTAESARKSRQAARRLQKRWPGAKLAVCGCWPQAEPEEAKAVGAGLVGGSGERIPFVAALEALGGEGGDPVLLLDEALRRRQFEILDPARMEGRTRAYLKVEDGCVNFCTYCIIPFLRGPVRSMPLEEAARKAAALAAGEVKELTLTGIELASYQYGLPDLVEAVAAAAPGVRIRLGSLEPRAVDEEFCARLSALEGLCPHFHLSLQSGCDATLERMGRKYGTARFYRSVELLRRAFPDCGISADLITGFPGETEEEFSATLDFLDRCRFSHVHVFPYSERKGTKAASMPGSVPKGEREERARRAIARAAAHEEAFLRAQTGRYQEVLFESRMGHTPNYCETELLPGREGEVVRVLITGVKNGRLTVKEAI
ncbi:MAG: MiaB/RimO family radical SAM methylthiotransferase [Oscillospiraceae bacterium]|nr:MiaB/RimO family radical SAM methylthiotransferase [Oscillospiraceae bacterium]